MRIIIQVLLGLTLLPWAYGLLIYLMFGMDDPQASMTAFIFRLAFFSAYGLCAIFAIIHIGEGDPWWWILLPLGWGLIMGFYILGGSQGIKTLSKEVELRKTEKQQAFDDARRDFICPTNDPNTTSFLSIDYGYLSAYKKDSSIHIKTVGYVSRENSLIPHTNLEPYRDCKNKDGKTIYDVYTIINK